MSEMKNSSSFSQEQVSFLLCCRTDCVFSLLMGACTSADTHLSRSVIRPSLYMFTPSLETHFGSSDPSWITTPLPHWWASERTVVL